MAVTIRWTTPTGTNWTHSRVYRSATKDGTYSLLTSVAVGIYSYLDSTGSSSYWYKISYWDGVNESSLSNALKGDQAASYVALSHFRLISNFSTNEISDNDVLDLAIEASRYVILKVNSRVKLERQLLGAIDGTNTFMYTKHKPIADTDFDSDVDGDDVKVYYATWDNQNVRNYGSVQAVSSVDEREGRITMTTAPTSTTAEAGVFITYSHTIENIDYDLLKLAATYLCAHLTSLKIRGETPNYSMITAPYLRQNVAGPKDIYKHGFLKQYTQVIQEVIGHGTDGLGFTRVKAEAN